MKVALILTAIAWALLLGGCADQSLMTDEDYYKNKGPAPHSPDFSNVLPNSSSTYPAGY
jgi:hypothetical protein